MIRFLFFVLGAFFSTQAHTMDPQDFQGGAPAAKAASCSIKTLGVVREDIHDRKYEAAEESLKSLVRRGSYEALVYLMAFSGINKGKALEGHKLPKILVKDPAIEALLDLTFRGSLPQVVCSKGKRRKKQVDQKIFTKSSYDDFLDRIYLGDDRKITFIKRQPQKFQIRMLSTAQLKLFDQQQAVLQLVTNYITAVENRESVIKRACEVLRYPELSSQERRFYNGYLFIFQEYNSLAEDKFLKATEKVVIIKTIAPFLTGAELQKRCGAFMFCEGDKGGALESYKKAADQDDGEAQLRYAQVLEQVFPKKIEEIQEYYRLAAQKGLEDAQLNYALKCFNRERNEQDMIEAREYFKRAADKGNYKAQLQYAYMLEVGKGGEKNLEEAKHCYKLLVEQENTEAESRYALLLFKEGGEENLVQARVYYKKAADKGNVLAQFNYASMCHEGQGGGKNLEEARKYFKLAANSGDEDAQFHYAFMADNAQGGDRDLSQALSYYKRAADAGVPQAQHNYAVIQLQDGVEQDLPQALYYLGKAAEAGCVESYYHYAALLQKRKRGPKDFQISREYFKKAADEADDKDAQFQYAFMVFEGLGGSKSLEEARQYYKLAADKKMPEALYNYADMLMSAEGGEANPEEATKCLKISADLGFLPAIRALSEAESITQETSDEEMSLEEAPTPKAGGGKAEEQIPRKNTITIKFSKEKPKKVSVILDPIAEIQDRKAQDFVRCFFDPQMARGLNERNLEPTLKALGASVQRTKSGYIAKVLNPNDMVLEVAFSWHKGHGKSQKVFHKGGFRRSLQNFFEVMGFHPARKISSVQGS